MSTYNQGGYHMKKMMCLLFLMIGLFTLSACRLERTDENFIYRPSGSIMSIVGLTEEGMNEINLVIPLKFNDRYVQLGMQRFMVVLVGEIKSDVAQRIFYLSELKSVISLNSNDLPQVEKIFVFYLDDFDFDFGDSDIFQGIYSSTMNSQFEPDSTNRFYANVSYQYNYESAPNDGYYWIDDYDDELIKYQPEDPKRDGFTFAGWYHDENGLMLWDFNEDIIPAKIYIEDEHQFVETKLYAKWI